MLGSGLGGRHRPVSGRDAGHRAAPHLPYRSSKWVRRNPVWAFVGVLAVLAGITGLLTWQGLMPRVRLVNGTKFRPAVAVLGFRNLNGRADTSWLSATFAELFTTELGAGGRTRMIPPDDIESLKKELGIAPGEGLSRAALARIRERAGSCMLLTGSYLIVGDGPNSPLRLDLRLIDAETGEVITALNESGPQKDLLGIVARAGTHLRGKFANAALTEADETHMRASQPASAEAARLFAEGLTAFRNYQTIEARDLLEKAVKADPRHAMSYAALAGTLSSLGYDAKAREAAKKAFDLSPNLSREDALFIEGRYREITRSWKRAAEIYKTLWGFFPDNLEYGLRLASVQIPAGSPTEALSTVEALRRYPKPMSDDPRIDLNEAEAALALQEYKRADQAASIALRKGEAHNSRILVARADLASARALSGLGDGARAIQRISDAQRIYQQLGHRRGVSLALSELANALDEQGDLNGARKAYEDSLQVCREIGNKSGEATALNNLGVLFHKEGDFGRAISYHKETLELRRALEDKSGEALAIGNIANALFEQGDLAGAKENYERSLALYRQAGLQRSIARILTSLGMTVREMGDLATAKDLVEQSLAIRREAGDTLGETRAQYYRAIVLHDNGDLREARQLFEEALASRRKQGDKEWIARTLEGMGLLAISSNDLPQARNYLEEALALRIGTNDRNGVARSRLALAYLSLAEKRSQTAEEMAHDAMTEFEREKATVGQAECLLVIARAMKAERKVGDAARNLDRAESLASSAGAGRIRQLVAHARSGLKY